MTDRGTVELGKAADLVVFDPDSVGPGPLRRARDFPANGERLTADAPIGVEHVLVNGIPIREQGRSLDNGESGPEVCCGPKGPENGRHRHPHSG